MNEHILGPQMVAAASELPLTEADAAFFGGRALFLRAVGHYCGAGVLKNTMLDPDCPPLWEYTACSTAPQREISLRGSSMSRIASE